MNLPCSFIRIIRIVRIGHHSLFSFQGVSYSTISTRDADSRIKKPKGDQKFESLRCGRYVEHSTVSTENEPIWVAVSVCAVGIQQLRYDYCSALLSPPASQISPQHKPLQRAAKRYYQINILLLRANIKKALFGKGSTHKKHTKTHYTTRLY